MNRIIERMSWLGILIGVLLVTAGAFKREAVHVEASLPLAPAQDDTLCTNYHVPIESIRVGDRVLTGSPADQDRGTSVDPSTWKHVTLRAQWRWPDGTEDVFNVETLQSPEWLLAQAAATRRMVALPLDVREMGCPEGLQGEIIRVADCPVIADGPGKVVLTTVNHLNPRCRELEVIDAGGVTDRIRTTDFHPFWSETKQGWVQAYTLSIGDHLLGLDGQRLKLQSYRKIEGVHTVYNLTVEDEHVYRVGLTGALVHNNCGTRRRPQTPGDGDYPSEAAARREAFRRNDVPTSEPNNFRRRNVYGQNENLRGPNGEPYEILDVEDLHGNPVQIDHHNWGHDFEDNQTYEWPHYQGPDGEHLNYPPHTYSPRGK